eukprot:TRINITY_DN8170_c0_g1_i1.p1 TRINITY_DN8170_c0_g1~~TRINITY_DN8170_c0_g1_i1.p1  ORF type:complete len:882 (+),score=188.28 TRINITY_DN8170_c0_g1_i1:82-2727(+)
MDGQRWRRSPEHWDDIPTALAALRRGELLVVMDDESRENEGDLVASAELATGASLAFMCRYSSGLLCAPMTQARAKQLELDPMVSSNTDRNQTAFTVSVDVLEGTTSGASAYDRAATARRLAHPDAKPADFSRPGHLFPLIAKDGGVLERDGHTEASVDLCFLAGLEPVAVIGELMRSDGTMMRLQECREFAAQHDLKIINVEQLQLYRQGSPTCSRPLTTEGERRRSSQIVVPPVDHADIVELTAECLLPMDITLYKQAALAGHRVAKEIVEFRMRTYRSLSSGIEHVMLIKGDIEGESDVMTRVHSVCITGDVFASQRCDCGDQLKTSIKMIAEQDKGMVIYIRDHEGRGIGLTQKARAYRLQQEHGMDTYEANQALGLQFDARDYREANAMIKDIGVSSVELVTNNALKVDALAVPVTKVHPLRIAPCSHNLHYLEAKKHREQAVLNQLTSNGLSLDGPKGHLVPLLKRQPKLSMERHRNYMARALELALRGRVTAPPNPWVGCVLVNEWGQIVGEGYHHAAGQPHAEIEALRDAAQRYAASHNTEYEKGDTALVTSAVTGCTAYVTLEPCHHHGRTPPCDLALVKFGIQRVVIAVTDPDARVDSAGVQLLRSHNIEVITDVCREEVEAALQPYLHQRSTGRPYVVLKAGCSLDAKIACPDSSSQWITSTASRAAGHRFRAESQAILVGATTAVVDKPRLNPRIDLKTIADPELAMRYLEPRPSPLLRVVLDGQGKLKEGPLLDTSGSPTLIFTSEHCDPTIKELWLSKGVQVEQITGVRVGKSIQLDLDEVLAKLGERGILQLLVEGGAGVQGQFLQRKLVDQLQLFFGNTLLGEGSRSWPQASMAASIDQARRWKLQQSQALGNDIWATYVPDQGE